MQAANKIMRYQMSEPKRSAEEISSIVNRITDYICRNLVADLKMSLVTV